MNADLTIHELGAIKNRFGLLSNDLRKVQSAQFLKFLGESTSKSDMARILNVPRPSVYQSEIKLPLAFVKDRLVPIAVSADLAVEVFNDLEKARLWMLTPNSYFFGQTPFDVCVVGKGGAVIEFLLERLGKTLRAYSGEKDEKIHHKKAEKT